MSHPLSATDLAVLMDTPLRTLEGHATTLAAHRGTALLLVNVASACGLTPQYEGLERLHETYGPRGLAVLGFPCNQFAAQEPGSAAEIRTFCTTRYGVTFPLFAKLEVNGPGRHPLYAVLARVPDAQHVAGDVEWNFEKFLVTVESQRVSRFRPETEPLARELVGAIETALPTR